MSAGCQLPSPLSLELVYVYRQKHFTTDIPGDPLRGDVDHLHQSTVKVHYDLSPAPESRWGTSALSAHPI
jgi:hypothetical protein